MSGVVGAVARGSGAGLAGVVGAQAVGGAVVGAAGGALFGLAYGTAIRIGYEQIYPALFPDGKPTHDLIHILDALEKMFDFVGGKAAHIFGVEQGVKAHTSIETENFTYGNIRKEESQTFLDTLDKFFKSITPLPQAFGHTEDTPNLNQNLATVTNTTKGFNDAIESAKTADVSVKDFRDKISNYNYGELNYLLENTTDSAKRHTIIQLIYATPEGAPVIEKTPVTQDAIRRSEIAASGLAPSATAAVNQFKTTIDSQQRTLAEQIAAFRIHKKAFDLEVSRNGQNKYRLEQTYLAAKKLYIATGTRLGALRLKFQSSYGYWY